MFDEAEGRTRSLAKIGAGTGFFVMWDDCFYYNKKDKKIVVAFSDRSCCACVGLAPSVADVLALA